jgi:hypothetical protein
MPMFDSFFSSFQGLILLVSIGGLALLLAIVLSRRPKEHLWSGPIPPAYTADNTKDARFYVIEVADREQRIAIPRAVGEWMYVRVYPFDEHLGQGRPEFEGWATRLPTDRFVRPDDLAATLP